MNTKATKQSKNFNENGVLSYLSKHIKTSYRPYVLAKIFKCETKDMKQLMEKLLTTKKISRVYENSCWKYGCKMTKLVTMTKIVENMNLVAQPRTRVFKEMHNYDQKNNEFRVVREVFR